MTPPLPKDRRTPAAWRSTCLEILRARVHAEDAEDPDANGRFIEFTRTDANGLHLSYNFVRVRDEQHLGFALSFGLERSEALVSPFSAGSRFDHNRSIWRLFSEDFALSRRDAEYPAGVWSNGVWRDNTFTLLEAG